MRTDQVRQGEIRAYPNLWGGVMVPLGVRIPRRRRVWVRERVQGRPVYEEGVSGHEGINRGGVDRTGQDIHRLYTRGCEMRQERRSGSSAKVKSVDQTRGVSTQAREGEKGTYAGQVIGGRRGEQKDVGDGGEGGAYIR